MTERSRTGREGGQEARTENDYRGTGVYFLAASFSSSLFLMRAWRAPSLRWLARAVRSVRNASTSFSADVMARGASATRPAGIGKALAGSRTVWTLDRSGTYVRDALCQRLASEHKRRARRAERYR